MASIVETLAKELERLLPLAKALAEVETKGTAAQKLLDETTAKQSRAERAAAEAQRASVEAIAKAQTELQEKTASFKADLVTRHTALSREYDDLKAEWKAARERDQEAVRQHKDLLREMQEEVGLTRAALHDVQTRLATAKAEFAKALAGATV